MEYCLGIPKRNSPVMSFVLDGDDDDVDDDDDDDDDKLTTNGIVKIDVIPQCDP